MSELLVQDARAAQTDEQLQSSIDSAMGGFINEVGMDALEREMTRMHPSLYTLRFKPIRRKPMTFQSKVSPYKHRPWQQGILDDKSADKVVMKARQLGLSELSVSEVIWFLDVHDDTKAIYTFPRMQQMQDFSTTRITPAFQESDYLKALLSKEANNVALKKIGNSWLFMRSAWGAELGEGVDADALFFDEYDRMDINRVELAFRESLKSSQYGWMRRWSTPTIPGYGVDGIFNKSDMKRYFWTCEHCGERQYLTIDDNVLQVKDSINLLAGEVPDGSYIIGCKKCKKELNRWTVGEWVAQERGRSTSGYAISQLDATWISADDIMRRSLSYPSRQLFHNYVIGVPYTAVGLLINDDDILSSIRLPAPIVSRTNDYTHIAVGIDWGQVNYMFVLGLRGGQHADLLDVYWIEDNPSIPLHCANMFTAILRAYQPDIIVADAGYGADRNSYMYTQFPYAFYSCTWTTVKDADAKARFIPSWNEKAHEVTCDKTVCMQRCLHQFKGKLISLPPMSEKMQLVTKHLKNVRIMDNEDDGKVYQTATRVGPDHLACAGAYALLGVDKLTAMGTNRGNSFAFDFV